MPLKGNFLKKMSRIFKKITKEKGIGVFTNHDVSPGQILLESKFLDELNTRSKWTLEKGDHHLLIDSPAIFINHSCIPNGKIEWKNGAAQIISTRSIKMGEEINIDYFESEKDIVGFSICLCGSTSCPVTVPNFKSNANKSLNMYTLDLASEKLDNEIIKNEKKSIVNAIKSNGYFMVRGPLGRDIKKILHSFSQLEILTSNTDTILFQKTFDNDNYVYVPYGLESIGDGAPDLKVVLDYFSSESYTYDYYKMYGLTHESSQRNKNNFIKSFFIEECQNITSRLNRLLSTLLETIKSEYNGDANHSYKSKMHNESNFLMRFLFYPDISSSQIPLERLKEHKDDDLISVISELNASNSLEIKLKDDKWHSCEIPDDSFLILLGTLSEKLFSNLNAPYHRVISKSSKPRFVLNYTLGASMNEKFRTFDNHEVDTSVYYKSLLKKYRLKNHI